MKQTKRLSVLYAEENEDSGFMLMTLLGQSNVDVSLASTVKETFLSAQNGKFDLFLLASRFPDGSGFELCQQLHTFAPQIPIVFYSGDALETDRAKGIQAGADAYLVKPEVDTVAPTIIQLVKRLPKRKGKINVTSGKHSSLHSEIQIPLTDFLEKPKRSSY